MRHPTAVETPYPGQHLYTCGACSWRMVEDHGALTWIDYGDLDAIHSGSTDTAVELRAELG